MSSASFIIYGSNVGIILCVLIDIHLTNSACLISNLMINTFTAAGRPFQCADCSAEDPQWASLNKGVLICSECCYVHRNLGYFL